MRLVRDGPPGLFSRGDLSRLEDHVEDGMRGVAILAELAAASIVDVGSGGGVPGIPVAVGLPRAQVHLVESQAWKAAFLRECIAELDLESRVTVHPGRAEQLVAVLGREQLDAGIARAVAAPAVVAEYLAPLVRVGGHLLLWSTREHAQGLEAWPGAELLGLDEPRVVPAPTPLRDNGALIVWPRRHACSDRVPRRPGVAARRPLR